MKYLRDLIDRLGTALRLKNPPLQEQAKHTATDAPGVALGPVRDPR
jgi:hypothetical protein